ncbi:hypothetical protein ACP80I_09670, partial [Escherichia coli]
SANYIGARSVTAAIKPDIKLQPTRHVKTMDALQTGCVHIKYYLRLAGYRLAERQAEHLDPR